MFLKTVTSGAMLFLTASLALWNPSQAQGGAAIITLVMPPPGGDGYSVLQTGGAIPAGAASLYYNPALASELQRETGSQLHVTHSGQDLLPALALEGLKQDFTGTAVVIPNGKGFDLGIGFFRNHLDFGQNLTPNDSLSSGFEAYETVYGLGGGIRLGLPVSLGATAKYYDSYLSSSVDSNGQRVEGRSTGWAFDLGLAVNPRFRPLSRAGSEALELFPSFGLAWTNLGPDAWYVTPSESDPLPQSLRAAFGVEVRFADLVGITVGLEREKDTFSREGFWSWDGSLVRTYGYVVDVGGLQFSRGRLEDAQGDRSERHKGLAYEFNLLRVHRLLKRMEIRDFHSAPEALESGYLFPPRKVLGLSFRANPRLVIGQREIHSEDNGIREGQKAWYFSVSL